MYIVQNAMKNLLRNKGRNGLMAAVTLAIVASAAITLTINNAASKVIDTIRLELGSRVEIRQDFIEMKQSGLGREDAAYVSMSDFLEYGNSEYLSKTIYSANMYAWSDTFRAVGDESETPGATTRVNDDGQTVSVETCKLVSTSEPADLAEFGTSREIVEGRMFDGLNECVISEDLAALNGITVGDTLTLSGTYAAQNAYSLTVVGIYADYTDEYINLMLMFNGRFADNRRNEIITSFDTLTAAGWETNAGLDMKSAYFLKNPDDITKFEREVRGKGLPVTYNVSINQAAYDKVAGPLSGMRGAVVTFMTVILILGGIVLALISFMAVRERKYEVGVLRAMGMERGKVAFGILCETAVIAALCLVVGLGIGTAAAQPIADGILAGKVAEAEAETAASGAGNKVLFAGGQMQTNDAAAGFSPESEIQVSLGGAVIVQIILITIGLAALSGVIGIVIITKYEPLKILRERN